MSETVAGHPEHRTEAAQASSEHPGSVPCSVKETGAGFPANSRATLPSSSMAQTQHPLLWCAMKPTLPRLCELDQHPEPHSAS
jgi:hypothetical protein